jgi:death-on-curing protein
MTFRYGGSFFGTNVLNPDSLDYVVEAVQASMFGIELYPEISLKAALYMRTIIAGHVFRDGNKRTGLSTALVFLKINKRGLKSTTKPQSMIDFANGVAEGKHKIEDINVWFARRIQ